MGSVEVPEKWDESWDVVVVGGGFAGLAAAYSAEKAGSSVVLVEKFSTTGGNSAINGGQYAAYTSKRAAELQQKLGLEPDTAEKHIEDTIKGGDNMSNPALVREMVYASPVYFDLLLDNGLQIRETLARPGGHYGYRTYVTENQVGSDITNLQLKMLKETSATIELETKMVEIYRTRDEANRVVGIRVGTADGYKTIEAKKGVIMATGGFSANVQMRETQVPYLTEELPTTNIKAASTGEGIYLAQAIGANTTQMSNISVIRGRTRTPAFWISTRCGRSPARPTASFTLITTATVTSTRATAATSARTLPSTPVSSPPTPFSPSRSSPVTSVRKKSKPVSPMAAS